jgi:hypothetical protein
MTQAVYILCAATSLLCAILLWRGYRRSGARLLLWSCLCFLFLTLNNVLLFIDIVLYPETTVAFSNISFAVLRSLAALAGLLLLVVGLIWDSP